MRTGAQDIRLSRGVIAPYTPELSGPWPIVRRALAYTAASFLCLIYGMGFGLLGPFAPMLFVAPLAIIALMIIWALPDSTKAPVRLMEILFFSFTIASAAWPNYLAVAIPGLPWITASRLTGIPLVLCLLVSTSVSKSFRTEMARVLSSTPTLWRLLVVFVGIQLLSVGISSQKAFSLDRFITAQTSWTATFFVSVYILSKPGQVRTFVWTLFGLAAFITIIGLIEGRVQHVLWAGHIPSFLKIEDQRVLIMLHGVTRTFGRYRVQSTMGPIQVGEFMGLVTPFLLHYIYYEKRLIKRAALVTLLPMIAVVILETQSRSGFTSLLMSLVMYQAYWAFSNWRHEKGTRQLLGMTIVAGYPVAVIGLAAAVVLPTRLRALVFGGSGTVSSTEARKAQWNMGIPKILSHPWGHGIGRSGDALGYLSPDGSSTVDSYYLTILLDYGFVGFALYFGMFLYAIWRAAMGAIKVSRLDGETALIAPAGIALVNFVVTKSVFSEESNHAIVFMLLGMVAALTARIEATPTPPPILPSRAGKR